MRVLSGHSDGVGSGLSGASPRVNGGNEISWAGYSGQLALGSWV
jgi:hypothetical protein